MEDNHGRWNESYLKIRRCIALATSLLDVSFVKISFLGNSQTKGKKTCHRNRAMIINVET